MPLLMRRRLFDAEGRAPALVVLAILCLGFGAGFIKTLRLPPPTVFQPPFVFDPSKTEARIQTRLASSQINTQTHAAAAVELGDGRIRAFWYAGSREGASDVEIRSAVFDPRRGRWSPEQTVATREQTQRSLWRHIKKLGNPVALRANDGTLWLFYVTVSAGGWSGSSITAMTSSDDGATWGSARRLITSPFLNVSTLVKGTPFLYADGTIGLPVYHEFATKFGELLRLDGTGAVIDKQRLIPGGYSLQPVMLVRSPTEALVLMRSTGAVSNRVIATQTSDAGETWTAPALSALLNPNAAVAGVALPDGRLLVALNNVEENRDALSLLISTDGIKWKTVYQLEDQRARHVGPDQYRAVVAKLAHASDVSITNADAYAASAQRQMCAGERCDFEFSYPYLIQTQTGDFHLVYTWNRAFIKHVVFSRTWLEQRIATAADDQHH